MVPNSILASQLFKIFLGPQPPDSSLNMHALHADVLLCSIWQMYSELPTQPETASSAPALSYTEE